MPTTIIIAPHHTISLEYNNLLHISNFLTYADFFLKLYSHYPQIHFIFRPHPLLFSALKQERFWGIKKTKHYFDSLKNFHNVTYQEGGDYFETFIQSDAIIHDCASFLCEYLFTEKPACYLLKNKESIEKNFNDLGKESLNHYYQAFNEKDILHFIENVVLKKQDTKKEQRLKYAQENLKINYPNVADFILKDIKKSLHFN